jgi:ABC-type lipoprotein export system ATPase subunit
MFTRSAAFRSKFSGRIRRVNGRERIGKSTLMNILGCLDRPTSGSTFWTMPTFRCSIAISSQTFVTASSVSCFRVSICCRELARENVELPLLYGTRSLSNAQLREKADAVSRRLGSRPRRSSSEPAFRRSATARRDRARIVNDPEVVLADEPTGNLDSRTSVEIMGIFNSSTSAASPSSWSRTNRTSRLRAAQRHHARRRDPRRFNVMQPLNAATELEKIAPIDSETSA